MYPIEHGFPFLLNRVGSNVESERHGHIGLNSSIIGLFQMHFIQKFSRFWGPKSTVSVEFAKAFKVGEDNREPAQSLAYEWIQTHHCPFGINVLKLTDHADPLFFAFRSILCPCLLLSASQGRLTAAS